MNVTKKHIAVIAIIFIIAVILSIFTSVMLKNNIETGIWVKGNHMNNVDLDTLSKNGVENIFLHSSAVNIYGEKDVSQWIEKANSKNIRVHIWVQCFYNGTWINPINTTTKDYNYPHFNTKIDEIEKLANIPGVGGIQLDYIRYPGNAYEYDYSNNVNSVGAVNKFVSMASDKIKEVNRNKNIDLTISIAVMPERVNKKYYGQDVWTLSQYVDVVIPMAYAGNYKILDSDGRAEWIKNTATYFKGAAMWSNVCIGIQTYESDSNETPLPASQLQKESQAAFDGGADGVALFTWELMKNWFDLSELNR
ncbi:MAG: putative glycoside hydrolase [Methanobrevibacter sp.]|nr:putative glycoside hydrolase [Methanobrevibacter sp.]